MILSANDFLVFLQRYIPALKDLHVCSLQILIEPHAPVRIVTTEEFQDTEGRIRTQTDGNGFPKIVREARRYELTQNGAPVSSDAFFQDIAQNFPPLKDLIIHKLTLTGSRKDVYRSVCVNCSGLDTNVTMTIEMFCNPQKEMALSYEYGIIPVAESDADITVGKLT